MANRKVIVAAMGLLIACNATTIDSKAMSLSDTPATVPQYAVIENMDNQEEMVNPDLNLSEEELLEKYANMGYDAIQKDYELNGYSEEEFLELMKKCPTLKYKYTLTSDELEELYHVIFAEVGNQSYETIKSTTSVVINRLLSDRFPNTIKDVLEQPGQFQVVTTGVYLKKSPNQNTIDAVNDILINGTTIESNVLFFRDGCYHSSYAQAFVSGDMYFSSLS